MWFIAVWFLYPSFIAHGTASQIIEWMRTLRGELSESEALAHNYYHTHCSMREWRVIQCALIIRNEFIHSDLWFMIDCNKKHFYVLSLFSSDPIWWFLHEKCTLKCHNKLWDSQLHPSNKSASRFCAFLSLLPFFTHSHKQLLEIKIYTSKHWMKIYGFN